MSMNAGVILTNILEFIKTDQFITAKQLSRITGKSESTIRMYINRYRADGIPICSTTRGYYLSVNKGDILATIQFLERRIQTQIQAVDGLRRVVMKDE